MANKIYLNHTLEEYNKKYGDKNLKKVNKVDVDNNKSLLDGKSWWLINDIYYEVPTNKGFKGWWSNLGKTGQIVTCCLAGAAVVTAVVVPTVIAVTKNKTVEHQAVIDSSIKDVTCTQKKLDNGALEVTLSYDTDKKQLDTLEVYMGNEKLLLNQDYTLEGNKIVIAADVLAKNKTYEITIKPILKDKKEPEPVKPVYVTEITCDQEKTIEINKEISFDDLHVKITPEDATDKSFSVTIGGQANDEGTIEIDETNKKIKAKAAGFQTVFVIAKGSEEEGSVGTSCTIYVVDSLKTASIDMSELTETLGDDYGITLSSYTNTINQSESDDIEISYDGSSSKIVPVTLRLGLFKSDGSFIQELDKVTFVDSKVEKLNIGKVNYFSWEKISDKEKLTVKIFEKSVNLAFSENANNIFQTDGITITSLQKSTSESGEFVDFDYSQVSKKITYHFTYTNYFGETIQDIGDRLIEGQLGTISLSKFTEWDSVYHGDTIYIDIQK